MFERVLLPKDSSKSLETVMKDVRKLLNKIESSLTMRVIISVCVPK